MPSQIRTPAANSSPSEPLPATARQLDPLFEFRFTSKHPQARILALSLPACHVSHGEFSDGARQQTQTGQFTREPVLQQPCAALRSPSIEPPEREPGTKRILLEPTTPCPQFESTNSFAASRADLPAEGPESFGERAEHLPGNLVPKRETHSEGTISNRSW